MSRGHHEFGLQLALRLTLRMSVCDEFYQQTMHLGCLGFGPVVVQCDGKVWHCTHRPGFLRARSDEMSTTCATWVGDPLLVRGCRSSGKSGRSYSRRISWPSKRCSPISRQAPTNDSSESCSIAKRMASAARPNRL